MVNKKRNFHKSFKYLLIVLIICTTVFVLIKPLVRLPHKIYIDYNEGWMAYFSEYAINQTSLYQPLDAFILNNYPPISFYITGIIGNILGDMIIAGRILALLGLLLTTVMIAFIIYRFTNKIYLSIIGAILFLSYMCIHHGEYVGMNDPQWIAHGFMMSGFVLFLYQKENKVLLFCSMLLIIVAILIKHNLIPVPIVITLWLYLNDKRHFYYWIGTGILLTTIALLSMFIIYGADLFIDILMTPRIYRIGKIVITGIWLMPSIVYISTALILYIVDFKNSDIQMLFLFSTISIVWGAISAGGAGIYYNAIFDFIISLFIASFVAVDRLSIIVQTKIDKAIDITVPAIFILFLPLIMAAPFEVYKTKEFLNDLHEIKRQTEEDIAFVADYPEPVMCENLALCYWAGKKFSFDFYTTGQKLKTGRMPKKYVIDQLDKKEFSLIQINDENGEIHHLTDDITKKIFEKYSILRHSKESGLFLVPSKF